MKTAGQILQATRIMKKMELDDVARITKIRAQSLKHLENDDYGQLPSGTIARGFIRNYAQFLGLNPEHVLAVFRRDFVENQQGQIIPRGMVEPVNKSSFWTPKTTVIAGVALLFTLFTAYLAFQYKTLTGPPSLVVTEPVDGQTVAEDTVEVRGTTDPEATLAVNGQLVVLEEGGHFYLRLPIQPGQNEIIVVATGKSKKTTSITRTVNLTTTPQ